ncbi:MAG: hypothetical protein IJL44_05365 [Bacteroidales bacterium]|nr:hypothetical protein [Bacteroidales bacterium]
MKDSIIQRCPKCGKWCITSGKNAWQRFAGDTIDVADTLGELGDRFLGKPGKLVGKIWGGYSGAFGGVFNAIVGDRYQFTCPRCGCDWSTNDDTEDETNAYEHWRYRRQKCTEWQSITISKNPSKINSYIKLLSSELNEDDIDDETIAIIHDTLAVVHYMQNNKQEALNQINQSLELYDDDNSRALKGVILGGGRNSIDSYKALRELIHYRQTEYESPYFTKDDFRIKFENTQSSYVSHFLEIPQQQRRFVYLVSGNLDDKLTQLPDELYVLPIGFLPTEMHFKGAPTDQMLYVCHPYKPNLYIPYERYELELFRDELNEFCWVMDCLGAKKIDFVDVHSETSNLNSHEENNIHGGVGYKDKGSGKFDYNSEYGDELDENTKELLKSGKTFDLSPYTLPYIPKKDVVWYQHKQEWQRNCMSRLEGRLRDSDFTISTVSSDTLSESKRQKMEAEINVMLVELSAGAEHKENMQLKKTEARSTECHVEFYPLTDYEKITIRRSPIKSVFQPQNPEGKRTNWLVWVMGAAIVALAAGLIIALL